MMNRNEFDQYVADNIKNYLPPSFENASVDIRSVTKANDVVLTALNIRREGEQMIPNIYMEPYFERYRNGEPVDKIVGDIADVRIETDRSDRPFDSDKVMNYSEVKENLQIRLCDPEQNKERLNGLVSIPDGEYAKTFHIFIGEMSPESSGSYGTIAVTESLLNTWGISVEQLHADAMAAEDMREPSLFRITDIMTEFLGGDGPENLLMTEGPVNTGTDPINSLYCLTTKDKMYGASLMARTDILRQAAEKLGDSLFILPSSVHEVLLVPESMAMDAHDLTAMVREINENEVMPEERLSDKVQHFDKNTGVRENALARQERLEMDKEKRPSIHEQLAEKKAEVKAKDAAYTDTPKKSRVAEASL